MSEQADPVNKTSSPNSCIFCAKVSEGHSEYEDSEVILFKDISPASKTGHYLVIPTEHIANTGHLSSKHLPLLHKMVKVGNQKLDEIGFQGERRLGFHVPPFNSIQHLHLHVIAYPASSWFKAIQFSLGLPFVFMPVETLISKLQSE